MYQVVFVYDYKPRFIACQLPLVLLFLTDLIEVKKMPVSAKSIGSRVREARKHNNLTQKDIADHLGRTAASISELERGRVQISATDLMKIAELLIKPIEYFYGEDYSGQAVQDLIAIFRAHDPKERQGLVEIISSAQKMQNLSLLIDKTEDKNELAELVKEFYKAFQPFLSNVTSIQSSGMEAQQKLQEIIRTNK